LFRVNEQRTQNTRGLLRPDRKELLEQVGFLWRIKSQSGSILHFENQSRRNGKSTEVPQQSSADDLPSQSKRQKRSKKSHELSPVTVSDSDKDSVSLLKGGNYESLTPPLAYDPLELDFDLMIARLQSFRRQYGHEEIPPDYKAFSLGPWMVAMKAQARAGQLPDDQAQRLIDAGIVLIQGESQIWLECFWELRDFMMRFGHSQVSELDNPALSAWAAIQRRRDRIGKLSEARKKRLQKIGFQLEGSVCTVESPSSSPRPRHTSGMENEDMEASELEVDLLAAATSWVA
jgi:Helicase associated domain